MAARFTPATEAQLIAEELIPLYHKHLIENEILIKYLFSDQAPETHGRVKLGECAKVSGRAAYLAGIEEQESVLTFVCRYCRKWQIEAARRQVDVNGDNYDLCGACLDGNPAFLEEKCPNFLIARLEANRQKAEEIEAGGPPQPDAFFVITLYHPRWQLLSARKRRALVDHELCHAKAAPAKDGIKLWIQPHDVEEFTEIVERHGLWKGDVEDLVRAAESMQLRLEGFKPAAERVAEAV